MSQNRYYLLLIQIGNFKFPFIIIFNFIILYCFSYSKVLLFILFFMKRPFLIYMVFQIYIIFYSNFCYHILLVLCDHINFPISKNIFLMKVVQLVFYYSNILSFLSNFLNVECLFIIFFIKKFIPIFINDSILYLISLIFILYLIHLIFFYQ